MPKRYTIQELENFSDEDFIYWIAHDRQESVTNMYSPLNERLQQLMTRMARLSNEKDNVIGIKFVEETLQNQSSLKGDEISKLMIYLKEGLNNPKIRC